LLHQKSNELRIDGDTCRQAASGAYPMANSALHVVNFFRTQRYLESRAVSHSRKGGASVTQVDVREADAVRDRPGEVEDTELIARIARGDRSALETLYARHQAALLAYLLHFTFDRGVAEELLQDTLVAVWKNAHGFAGRSSVGAWLFGIARRRAYKRLRRRAPPLLALDAADDVVDTEPEPEAALLASADRAEVAQAVARLAVAHQEVLLLTFVHQLSYAEIADVLGVPLGTVKSRLNHAKRALRDLLRAAPSRDEGDR
jgi:RNA polymerase sigma-70 factor (ECF subfamily)